MDNWLFISHYIYSIFKERYFQSLKTDYIEKKITDVEHRVFHIKSPLVINKISNHQIKILQYYNRPPTEHFAPFYSKDLKEINKVIYRHFIQNTLIVLRNSHYRLCFSYSRLRQRYKNYQQYIKKPPMPFVRFCIDDILFDLAQAHLLTHTCIYDQPSYKHNILEQFIKLRSTDYVPNKNI